MRSFPLLLVALLLSGCAAQSGKLPVCDGQHRRPANTYGSVLVDTMKPSASTSTDPASFDPCGAPR
jgi:hypothetical protein